MPPMPARFAAIILAFAPVFVQRSWRHAQVLLVGAILAPGRRTVASLLRVGVETQRQWSDKAVARTTPCLLALFSIVTLLATRMSARERRRVAATAWYAKPRPTFTDAIAAVRRALWREQALVTSPRRSHRTKQRFTLPAPWACALCHAA